MVGSRLSYLLLERGYQVRHLSRTPKKRGDIRVFKWDIPTGDLDPEALKGVDTIIHLAGAGIMNRRWTPARKKELATSRIDSLHLIHDFLAKNPHQVKTLISSSALGYYPPNQAKELTESDPPGSGFLGQLCQAWENAAYRFEELGIRVAINRTGLVMASGGGVLQGLMTPMKWGISPCFGRGAMVYPWIHIDDLCGMILFEMENKHLKGAFNAIAPNALTQKEMNHAIAKQLGRGVLSIPMPVWVLQLVLGERASVLVDSYELSSGRIQKEGYMFRFPELEGALEGLV